MFIGQVEPFTRSGNKAKTEAVGVAVEHAGIGQAVVHLPAASCDDVVRRAVEFIFPSDENRGGEHAAQRSDELGRRFQRQSQNARATRHLVAVNEVARSCCGRRELGPW